MQQRANGLLVTPVGTALHVRERRCSIGVGSTEIHCPAGRLIFAGLQKYAFLDDRSGDHSDNKKDAHVDAPTQADDRESLNSPAPPCIGLFPLC